MTDIGIGDVVEAIADQSDSGVSKGMRDIVRGFWVGDGVCRRCGEFVKRGMVLTNHEPGSGSVSWHTCGWKKVGGSQADTVRRIAETIKGVTARGVSV